jgi:hypothetical protein
LKVSVELNYLTLLASQHIRLLVADIDNTRNVRVEEQDIIGDAECTLAEIITARGSLFNRSLAYGQHKNRGTIIVSRE